MESAQQYLNAGAIAAQIAAAIQSLGYEACAHIDGNYQVVYPLVARDAGLPLLPSRQLFAQYGALGNQTVSDFLGGCFENG